MLHAPARHEALHGAAWDEGSARAAIAAIVDDAQRRFDDATWWPLHPQDGDPAEPDHLVATPLYHGACGMHWGLDHLASRGYAGVAPVARDLDALMDAHRDWLRACADGENAAYLMGETPILLMAFETAPSDENADALERLIAGNVDHKSREFLWGAPGTMLAALFLFERTGDERWAALFRRCAETLWNRLEWSDAHACFHWTQDLYAKRSKFLGAGHGFAGNAFSVIRGRDLLVPDAWNAWQACIVETMSRTAQREDGRANWWAKMEPGPDASHWLVQWCHGAPGVVISLADLPGTGLDALLLEAGETTWHAGPLAKGSNLCHGTGGNGYAFLKLYRRTGNERWLDRARAFAMHGIGQVDAARAHYRQGRYSLWTGDVGFAIYLADCIEARASFPTLDVFWNRP